MTNKEKVIILFSLTCLADRFDMQDAYLLNEKQTKKFDKILEIYKNIFKDDNMLKNNLIEIIGKYINKLTDVKNNKIII